MKSADAATLAASLSADQRQALQIIKGRHSADRHEIHAEPLVVLSELGLVRRIFAADEVRELLELTQRGQKVAEFV
jgi:hypothetical protein